MPNIDPHRRKLLRTGSALALLALAWPSWADATSLLLINKAGRQRMLSQRIVKLFCQLGMGINTEQSRSQLQEAITLFDRQLAELKGNQASPALRTSLAQLDAVWQNTRKVALGPVNTSGARSLNQQAEALLSAAQQVTMDFQEAYGQAQGRLVNLAGRQRMLSQRLAKLFLLKSWGAGGSENDAALQAARAEFAQALSSLERAPENNRPIRQELELIRQQWVFFDNALTQASADLHAPTTIATASDRILQALDTVVGRYEKLLS